MIVERVNVGLKSAKAQGIKLARGKPKTASEALMHKAELEKRILRLHKDGTGILKIGKTIGVGASVMPRVVLEPPRRFVASAIVERWFWRGK
jgi:DNA invertase Pin-like site-specific DNA recombinase